MASDVEQLMMVCHPDPFLRRKCDPVETFDDELKDLIERMFEKMHSARGVGLAGPQVGVAKRLFVMNPTGEPDDALALINPVIHDQEGNAEAEEGCLSLPGVAVNVRRAQRCRVIAQDIHGAEFELHLEELPARICQHETDHLNGVLIIDRMGPADKIANKRALKALDDAYRSARGR